MGWFLYLAKKKLLTKVAGTNVGTVSKYPIVLVYERTKKYTPRNMMPSKHDKPPQIKHQTTYFRMPDRADTVRAMKSEKEIEKKNVVIRLLLE